MTTTVTTLQKGLPPFSPLRSQQFPGGSEILDRIQDLIKKQFDAYAPVVSEIARTLNINISGGGGGSSSSGRRVDTVAPLAGGGPLTADLTLSLNIDGSLQVTGGALGVGGRVANEIQYGAASGGGLAQSASLTYLNGALTIASVDGAFSSINLTSPSGARQINSHGGSFFVGTDDATQLGFYTNNANRLTISGAGVVTVVGLGTGLVKASAGVLGLGSGGTDYEVPLTFSTGLTRTSNTITANLSTGISGGQSVIGGTGLGENLTIRSTTSGTKGAILLGNVGSIGVVDENTGKQGWGQTSLDAFSHWVLSDDTTPTTLTAWDGRHAVFGVTGSAGGAVGISRTSGTNTGNLLFRRPGTAWDNAALYTQTFTLNTGGATSALTVDASQTTSALGALQVNGVTAPSSVMLCVGHTTQADRDRAQFFLGAGTLGPSGAGDSTLFDLIPSDTSMNGKSATGGIYATARIRGLTYTGGTLGDHVSKLASLYIDSAPATTVIGGTSYALYIASGDASVGGSVIAGSGLSNPVFVASPTAIGVFGATAVGQQTGGAATAGATYTATEQGMINRMYSALRNYGWIS